MHSFVDYGCDDFHLTVNYKPKMIKYRSRIFLGEFGPSITYGESPVCKFNIPLIILIDNNFSFSRPIVNTKIKSGFKFLEKV